MNGIRHRLAHSGVRNITGKYKESLCLSLRRERFSEILLFFWCYLCPGDDWEARSVSGQCRLRDFSRKEKHPWAALRLSAPVAQPHMLVVAPKVSSQARAARLKKSREKELHLRQQLQAVWMQPASSSSCSFLWDLDLAPRWKDICVGCSMKWCHLLARQELAEIKTCKSKKKTFIEYVQEAYIQDRKH